MPKPSRHDRLMSLVNFLWISLVVTLIFVLMERFLYHQPVTWWLVLKDFIIVVLALGTLYGSLRFVEWLFFCGYLFLIAGILLCGLGVLGFILLGLFHSFNAQHAHIVIISVFFIVLGVVVLVRSTAQDHRRVGRKKIIRPS